MDIHAVAPLTRFEKNGEFGDAPSSMIGPLIGQYHGYLYLVIQGAK